jgi:hypothetical protein
MGRTTWRQEGVAEEAADLVAARKQRGSVKRQDISFKATLPVTCFLHPHPITHSVMSCQWLNPLKSAPYWSKHLSIAPLAGAPSTQEPLGESTSYPNPVTVVHLYQIHEKSTPEFCMLSLPLAPCHLILCLLILKYFLFNFGFILYCLH